MILRENEEENLPKSKSQKKREMHSLQELGALLADLSEDQRKQIDLPEELREALSFAGKIKSRGAKRRQIQLIGKLMREADTEPIYEALAGFERGRQHNLMHIRQAEQWRESLISGNDSITAEITGQFTKTDPHKLRQLIRNARKERETEKPSGAARALFRYLMELRKEADRQSACPQCE
ncbi:MAG: ribosome biogenesis factor YjgA [Desulfococcaceae bacterium]